MNILFAGSYYYPSGGANDIVATDVNISALAELLEAFSSGNDWWHIYDTTTKSVVAEGRFEKPKLETPYNIGASFGMNPLASC